MKRLSVGLLLLFMFLCRLQVMAQEEGKLRLSGSLLTDQRVLLQAPNDWAWNENRLTVKLAKKFGGKAKFHTEVWIRNIGLPTAATSADLYNKGIVDPLNIDVREAYVQLNGFLSKNLDVKIGRQRIAWGTADRFNPTDNLNPYDLEDILDFGRHRGSDALSLAYYLSSDFSVQAVFIPFFQPANLPVGIFTKVLSPEFSLPPGMVLNQFTDSLQLPRYNLGESSVTGLRVKGFAGGVDFSLSYVYGRDGLPLSAYNTFSPDTAVTGGIAIHTNLVFARQHILGADLATNIGGVGVWAEAAAFLPEEVIMTNDFTNFFPGATNPITADSLLLAREWYLRYVIGADYHFANNTYLNIQYLHGFINERGRGNLNDYLFIQHEIRFLADKLKVMPLAGGFIVADWQDIPNNYVVIYSPGLSYRPTDNAEITLSAPLFFGKGDNVFARFVAYDMLMFRFTYSF